MKLIPFTDFPRWERDALHAALARLRMPLQHVCVSRLQPVPGEHDATLPPVVLVSAPGWSRTYERSDWLQALERDLAALAPAARASGLLHPDPSPSGPAPLGAE